MFWKKKKLEYDILIPPLEKAFEKFSLEEAEAYFVWYLDKIDSRVK